MTNYVIPLYNIGNLNTEKDIIKKIHEQSDPRTICKNVENLDLNNSVYEKISDPNILYDIVSDHLFSGIINQGQEPLHVRLEKAFSLKKKNNPFRKCYKKCIYRNLHTGGNNLTKRKRHNNRKSFRKRKPKRNKNKKNNNTKTNKSNDKTND